ncbi:MULTISPECIES: class I SAM-dependent methyltransferase [Natronospira]|uniref:Class I SAM-dependent methyltransferase n=1 Tax=Natronospira bacteriovora TaxID=3069753 RepID=A0ABU0W8I5_9GAMM|nr:class I SAM-dependent methyltransferase [Natronospira sp. AB-CW4]MDQ2070311.1 class I SAM-dependent methyltransferase [Natronospira sp. AB-CW4]
MIRSLLYDALIPRLTARWYGAVIDRLPAGCELLDVGIGTASALLANSERLREKRIRVTGVDIDAAYVERAQQRVATSSLADQVTVRLQSVYDHQGGPYDAVYFSASFMLLPDPEAALRHCLTLLKPAGRIYFTQTIQTRRSPFMERLKPMLKRISSIDFGGVTYEEDFKAQLQAAGLVLESFEELARRGRQAYCLAVARPAGAKEG